MIRLILRKSLAVPALLREGQGRASTPLGQALDRLAEQEVT